VKEPTEALLDKADRAIEAARALLDSTGPDLAVGRADYAGSTSSRTCFFGGLRHHREPAKLMKSRPGENRLDIPSTVEDP